MLSSLSLRLVIIIVLIFETAFDILGICILSERSCSAVNLIRTLVEIFLILKKFESTHATFVEILTGKFFIFIFWIAYSFIWDWNRSIHFNLLLLHISKILGNVNPNLSRKYFKFINYWLDNIEEILLFLQFFFQQFGSLDVFLLFQLFCDFKFIFFKDIVSSLFMSFNGHCIPITYSAGWAKQFFQSFFFDPSFNLIIPDSSFLLLRKSLFILRIARFLAKQNITVNASQHRSDITESIWPITWHIRAACATNNFLRKSYYLRNFIFRIFRFYWGTLNWNQTIIFIFKIIVLAYFF